MTGVDVNGGSASGLSWASVAERVGTRTEKQCRAKWLNQLHWREKGGAEWTKADDVLLIKKLNEYELYLIVLLILLAVSKERIYLRGVLVIDFLTVALRRCFVAS